MFVAKYVCDSCKVSAEIETGNREFSISMLHPETSPIPDKWGIVTITTNPGWSHRYARTYYFCPECREKLGLAPHQHIDASDMDQIVDAIFRNLVPATARRRITP